MARQFKTFVTGAIGPVIFYEWRGIPCARAKPTKVKQTKATKARAKEFGRAVRYSRLLRERLSISIPSYKDKPMMYRLNNALLQWVRTSDGDKALLAKNISALNGFEFYEDSELNKKLKVKAGVDFEDDKKIIVNIPALIPTSDIMAPKDTKTVEWTIGVARCKTNDLSEQGNDPVPYFKTKFEMDYSATAVKAQKIEIPFTSIATDIVLVVISLRYNVQKGLNLIQSRDKKWLPAAIVGAYYKQAR